MLGSMLTNLLFVFGVASLIGGFRWQVQELRITSGNVSVGMLLASTTGSLLPAALYYSRQLQKDDTSSTSSQQGSASLAPPNGVLQFSRVNAAVMMILYMCYLIFQLGTHKDEFDEEDNVVEAGNGHLLSLEPSFVTTHRNNRRQPTKRNQFCLNFWKSMRSTADRGGVYQAVSRNSTVGLSSNMRLANSDQSSISSSSEQDGDMNNEDDDTETGVVKPFLRHYHNEKTESFKVSPIPSRLRGDSHSLPGRPDGDYYNQYKNGSRRWHNGGLTRRMNGSPSFGPSDEGLEDSFGDDRKSHKRKSSESDMDFDSEDEKQMSLGMGVLWLLIITLGISAMSDILVDTIDGFAYRLRISEVFTSMVIVPFFSNIAEQVSAVIFAYHNKMDLMVGVTVGSAIQIAMFVLPGCVLIGLAVDRSMTLFFRGFETCCLFLGVIVVAAVLQGGTTNWLVGMTLIGIYIMIAAGIWFHELEDLSHDAELAIQNTTMF